MSCHTWFNKRVERTQEEATKIAIKNIKKERTSCWKIFKNPIEDKPIYINWIEYYQDIYKNINVNVKFVKELQLQRIKVYNRQIRMISNGYCKRAIWNRQGWYYQYFDGKGLYCDVNMHDLFRISTYPEDNLWSFDETLEFLEKNDLLIRFDEIKCQNPEEKDYNKRIWVTMNREEAKQNCINELKKFWEKYPDGNIHFG